VNLVSIGLGLLVGVVIGRALKTCDAPAAAGSASKTDVLAGLIKLADRAVGAWTDDSKSSSSSSAFTSTGSFRYV